MVLSRRHDFVLSLGDHDTNLDVIRIKDFVSAIYNSSLTMISGDNLGLVALKNAILEFLWMIKIFSSKYKT